MSSFCCEIKIFLLSRNIIFRHENFFLHHIGNHCFFFCLLICHHHKIYSIVVLKKRGNNNKTTTTKKIYVKKFLFIVSFKNIIFQLDFFCSFFLSSPFLFYIIIRSKSRNKIKSSFNYLLIVIVYKIY